MTDPRTELRDRIAAELADLTYLGRQLTTAHALALAAGLMHRVVVDVRTSPWLRAGYVIAELAEPSRSPSTESETPA